jgi:hypothetical protein
MLKVENLTKTTNWGVAGVIRSASKGQIPAVIG